MGLDITYASRNGEDIGLLQSVKLDVAFGSGENDFELTLDRNSGIVLEQGMRVYIEGTEYGGVIDERKVDSAANEDIYKGRSIHGILERRVLKPEAGQDYLKVNGEVNAVLDQLMAKVGLGFLVEVSTASTGVWVTYQFNRYTDAWTGILAMLKTCSMRPKFEWHGKTVKLQAVPIVAHPAIDTDLVEYSYENVFRPVNHLVCLGKGELRNRTVIHLFADAKGNISKTQTLFGLDEIEAVYESSNSEADELEKNGREKLEELQDASSVDINLSSDRDLALGDSVTSYDTTSGVEVTATIQKKIVTLRGDRLNISYTAGGSASGTSLSGGGSTSGGGIIYSAGAGITISNATISADVTQDKLDAVKAVAESAQSDASTASATSGQALEVANTAIQGVSVTEQITATRDGNVATVGHAASGVTAGTYGVTSTYQYPSFGGSFSFPQTLVVDAQGHVTSVQKGYARIPSTEASTSYSGLMSAADKAKLNGIETGANAYVLPAATVDALGGVKPDGITITVAADGTISAQAGGAAAFLAAWPVGSIYSSSSRVSPASKYGGTWKELPSVGSFKWERIA